MRPPLSELGLGRDPLNAALDGAQQAMAEMGVALARSIVHPIRTLEDLSQLPQTVARLIASSPEKTPAKGPGRWIYKTFTTDSKQARAYQEQITGRPAWLVYMVDGVEFDGFNGKELLEAKGASYKHFLTKLGKAQPWFEREMASWD